MNPIDWAVVGAYLAWMIWDGVRMSKRTGELEGYLRAVKSHPALFSVTVPVGNGEEISQKIAEG